jgi:Fe2+ or Zn2+ uptake regulation protein
MTRPEIMLRQAGKRVTRQRVLIMDIINQSKGHIAAEEIYSLAKQKSPRMSLSTVYRTLRVLKQEGMVEELDLGNERYHYEIKREDHHHMVCRGCGKVIEFKCPFSKELMGRLAEENNFEITGVSLTLLGYLLGYCDDCWRKRAE